MEVWIPYLIQFIILFATIISTHLVVSKQVKKNKKSDWIEKIRSEVSQFASEIMTVSTTVSTQQIQDLNKMAHRIILLLDSEDVFQKELESEISSIMILLTKQRTEDHLFQFTIKHNSIVIKTKNIIKDQTKRI